MHFFFLRQEFSKKPRAQSYYFSCFSNTILYMLPPPESRGGNRSKNRFIDKFNIFLVRLNGHTNDACIFIKEIGQVETVRTACLPLAYFSKLFCHLKPHPVLTLSLFSTCFITTAFLIHFPVSVPSSSFCVAVDTF